MRRVVGIGLVALDIVIEDDAKRRLAAKAGGSCGNVMALLAWLGWDAAPVARLGADPNADIVRDDLSRWGIDDRWISLAPPAATPVFIERLRRRSDGTVGHHFDRLCAACGGRLPRYQPVPRSALVPVIDQLSAWDVVYIDRPSAGAVRVAEAANSLGLLVLFEPSARGDERHLSQLAAQADIIKYSSERLTHADRDTIADASPSLEIETLGAGGLRYRTRSTWSYVETPSVNVRDTAGAGDWTTASLLYHLAELGERPEHLSDGQLRDLLRGAQRLGSWSCQFEGPRGAMEQHTPEEALYASGRIEEHGPAERPRRHAASSSGTAVWACTGCR